jgi:hypothetical protein
MTRTRTLRAGWPSRSPAVLAVPRPSCRPGGSTKARSGTSRGSEGHAERPPGEPMSLAVLPVLRSALAHAR